MLQAEILVYVVVNGLVPVLDFALALQIEWSAAKVFHFLLF